MGGGRSSSGGSFGGGAVVRTFLFTDIEGSTRTWQSRPVGKTRLAIEVAASVLDQYPGGTFFTELAPVTTPAGIAPAVLQATGIPAGGIGSGVPAEEQLIALLSSRRALLVLDNCEHLLDDTAEVVDRLLDGCPEATILSTSREPLGVEGEQVWRAPSLGVEGRDAAAVRLFRERAGAEVEAMFDDAQLALVVDVCRHLDGIPLAIELAASQTYHLSLDEIATRLGDRFTLLTGGRRRVQRQQTLLAAVDWSHDLLTDAERVLLRRLAVFPSWFDVHAIESVCADAMTEPPVQLLRGLVQKSLVAPDPRRSRYQLLETIRLYAEERLVAAGEAEGTRDRHCTWVAETIARLAATAGRSLDGLETFMELEDDIRAALRWTVDRGDLARAARILGSTGTYWWFTAHYEEGLAWLEAIEGADLPDVEWASLLGLRAALLMGRGDIDATVRAAEQAGALDRDETSPGRLNADGIIALMLLAAPGAEDRVNDLIRRAARQEDESFLRQARGYRAHLLLAKDPHAAVAEWTEHVATADPRRRDIADFFAFVDLGGARHLVGDHVGTIAVADELERRGFTIGRGMASTASPFLRVLALAGLRDLPGAHSVLEEFRERVRRAPAVLSAKDCAIATASLLVARGDLVPAARILGAVRGIGPVTQISPISFAIHRHYTLLVRERLPVGEGRRLYDEARAMDYLALVDAALD